MQLFIRQNRQKTPNKRGISKWLAVRKISVGRAIALQSIENLLAFHFGVFGDFGG